MKKIISLFKRDYGGNRQVYDEIVPGAKWVAAGQGVATRKFDGTCCLWKNARLWKRYDRKLTKKAKKRGPPFSAEDCKAAPEGWVQAEAAPDLQSGHWPGWLPVGNGPEDQWHREAIPRIAFVENQTYELIGPKIQGNPERWWQHHLIPHGTYILAVAYSDPPRDFDGLRAWLAKHEMEGIVWHHQDGRMVKIKRRDFGLPWPVPDEKE